MNVQLSTYIDQFLPLILTYSGNIILSIIRLIVWWTVIKWILKRARSPLTHAIQDISVRNFLLSFLWIFLKVVLLIPVTSLLWLESTSLIAALWTAWIAIWLALQWSLSNVAWWLLILIFKPFNICDYIQAQGEEWTVTSINVLYTILDSPQNQQITIPNGKLANNIVRNFSVHSSRMIEYTVHVSYDSELHKVKSLIQDVLMKNEKVKKTKEIFVWVESLGDKTRALCIRCRVDLPDYFQTSHQLLEEITLAFEANEIWPVRPKVSVIGK